MAALPKSLVENAGLVFAGEHAWPLAQLGDGQAEKLAAAANRCGRPNSDVLRRRLAVVDGAPVESWQIDFPTHFTGQEAALYEQPFARLSDAGPWQNPHANPDLRRALARLTRYLAMPVDAETPDWVWVEDELLPDASLVVVAREDDFTHGILSSAAFAAWHTAYCPVMPPNRLVESFPFPWALSAGLNALTAAQEESRHAVARAIRTGNVDALNEAVARAYSWPVELAGAELVERISILHQKRLAG
jgi:hypothetical protein